MSPEHAKVLSAVMAQTVSTWEKIHGPIPYDESVIKEQKDDAPDGSEP
jgi:hypothetical protein